MGWGDELMAAGEARKVRQETGLRGRIVGNREHPEHSKLWKYCPDVDQTSGAKVYAGQGYRPYIGSGHTWKKYTPIPARVELTDDLKNWAKNIGQGFVIVEANVKPNNLSKLNKDWGLDNYRQVIDALPQYLWVQPDYGGVNVLANAKPIKTPSFIHMLALMEQAAGYVGPEGGLHHAAAAFGKPAVVIFGGFISPEVTGYDFHHNIFTGEGLGCCARTKCECQCMQSISVEQVIDAVNKTIPLDQEARLAGRRGE